MASASPLKALLEFLRDSTLRVGLPVPLPMEEIYSWALPLRLPRMGSVILYTGALYQLMPYIESLTRYLSALEGSRVSDTLLRLARILIATPKLTRTLLAPEPARVERARRILTNISRLLSSSGVAHAYPYEDDLYSGVLLYDLGLDDAFAEVAGRVYRKLKEHGASTVITVDPHTTNILRNVYPSYVDGFDLEVVNYLEVLSRAAEESRIRLRGLVSEAVIHDPCFYARYLHIIDEPRKILERSGVKVLEPRRSREATYCCGGPVESVAPRLASKIAETRLKELAEKSKNVVVLCPICYTNLSRANKLGLRILDIAEVVEAEVPGSGSPQ